MCSSMYYAFLIALMVESGLAIKCYNCDSINNPGCEDLSDKNLEPEECDIDKQKEYEDSYSEKGRLWLLQISDFRYRRSAENEDNIKMVCQKLVGTEAGENITVRRCQIEGVDCNTSLLKLDALNADGNLLLPFCGYCIEDACNGSDQFSKQTQNFIFSIGLTLLITNVFRFVPFL